MGTNGQLFPLTDNTDGAAVDQVQPNTRNVNDSRSDGDIE
jgi:hypothetical protein